MSLFINPNDPNLEAQINNLIPTFGYCFFIDMVGSTELKDDRLSRWIIYTYNTFANITGFLFSKFQPIKCIGDELMFFIPERAMDGETPLTLYDCLVNIINSDEPFIKPVKISAVFCREAYEITFMRDYPDIYGKDIDLTARLASLAGSQEIIMNSEFVEKIRIEYNQILNKENFTDVPRIAGPVPQRIRGFRDEVDIFITRRH